MKTQDGINELQRHHIWARQQSKEEYRDLMSDSMEEQLKRRER